MVRDQIRAILLAVGLATLMLAIAVGVGGADSEAADGFEIEINDGNATMTEGDTLVVDATITNTGEETESQEIHLKDDEGEILTSIDDPPVTLAPGESERVRLTWESCNGDASMDEFSVHSNDDSATQSINIAPGPFYDVVIDETNAPITAGETLQVTVTVENTGNAPGYTGVWISLDDSIQDFTVRQLEPGEAEQTELTWDTTGVDAGNLTLVVSAAGTEAETAVTVEESDESMAVEEEEDEDRSASSAESTETTTPTQTAIPDTPNETADDGTGFGIGATLALLAVGLLLVGRSRLE